MVASFAAHVTISPSPVPAVAVEDQMAASGTRPSMATVAALPATTAAAFGRPQPAPSAMAQKHCAFFRTARGCNKGDSCMFSHVARTAIADNGKEERTVFTQECNLFFSPKGCSRSVCTFAHEHVSTAKKCICGQRAKEEKAAARMPPQPIIAATPAPLSYAGRFGVLANLSDAEEVVFTLGRQAAKPAAKSWAALAAQFSVGTVQLKKRETVAQAAVPLGNAAAISSLLTQFKAASAIIHFPQAPALTVQERLANLEKAFVDEALRNVRDEEGVLVAAPDKKVVVVADGEDVDDEQLASFFAATHQDQVALQKSDMSRNQRADQVAREAAKASRLESLRKQAADTARQSFKSQLHNLARTFPYPMELPVLSAELKQIQEKAYAEAKTQLETDVVAVTFKDLQRQLVWNLCHDSPSDGISSVEMYELHEGNQSVFNQACEFYGTSLEGLMYEAVTRMWRRNSELDAIARNKADESVACEQKRAEIKALLVARTEAIQLAFIRMMGGDATDVTIHKDSLSFAERIQQWMTEQVKIAIQRGRDFCEFKNCGRRVKACLVGMRGEKCPNVSTCDYVHFTSEPTLPGMVRGMCWYLCQFGNCNFCQGNYSMNQEHNAARHLQFKLGNSKKVAAGEEYWHECNSFHPDDLNLKVEGKGLCQEHVFASMNAAGGFKSVQCSSGCDLKIRETYNPQICQVITELQASGLFSNPAKTYQDICVKVEKMLPLFQFGGKYQNWRLSRLTASIGPTEQNDTELIAYLYSQFTIATMRPGDQQPLDVWFSRSFMGLCGDFSKCLADLIGCIPMNPKKATTCSKNCQGCDQGTHTIALSVISNAMRQMRKETGSIDWPRLGQIAWDNRLWTLQVDADDFCGRPSKTLPEEARREMVLASFVRIGEIEQEMTQIVLELRIGAGPKHEGNRLERLRSRLADLLEQRRLDKESRKQYDARIIAAEDRAKDSKLTALRNRYEELDTESEAIRSKIPGLLVRQIKLHADLGLQTRPQYLASKGVTVNVMEIGSSPVVAVEKGKEEQRKKMLQAQAEIRTSCLEASRQPTVLFGKVLSQLRQRFEISPWDAYLEEMSTTPQKREDIGFLAVLAHNNGLTVDEFKLTNPERLAEWSQFFQDSHTLKDYLREYERVSAVWESFVREQDMEEVFVQDLRHGYKGENKTRVNTSYQLSTLRDRFTTIVSYMLGVDKSQCPYVFANAALMEAVRLGCPTLSELHTEFLEQVPTSSLATRERDGVTFRSWLLTQDDNIAEAALVFMEANWHSDEFVTFAEIRVAQSECIQLSEYTRKQVSLQEYFFNQEYQDQYSAVASKIQENSSEAAQLKKVEKMRVATQQFLQAHVRALLQSTHEENALKDILNKPTLKNFVWFVKVNSDHIIGTEESYLVAVKEVVDNMSPAEIEVLSKKRAVSAEIRTQMVQQQAQVNKLTQKVVAPTPEVKESEDEDKPVHKPVVKAIASKAPLDYESWGEDESDDEEVQSKRARKVKAPVLTHKQRALQQGAAKLAEQKALAEKKGAAAKQDYQKLIADARTKIAEEKAQYICKSSELKLLEADLTQSLLKAKNPKLKQLQEEIDQHNGRLAQLEVTLKSLLKHVEAQEPVAQPVASKSFNQALVPLIIRATGNLKQARCAQEIAHLHLENWETQVASSEVAVAILSGAKPAVAAAMEARVGATAALTKFQACEAEVQRCQAVLDDLVARQGDAPRKNYVAALELAKSEVKTQDKYCQALSAALTDAQRILKRKEEEVCRVGGDLNTLVQRQGAIYAERCSILRHQLDQAMLVYEAFQRDVVEIQATIHANAEDAKASRFVPDAKKKTKCQDNGNPQDEGSRGGKDHKKSHRGHD